MLPFVFAMHILCSTQMQNENDKKTNRQHIYEDKLASIKRKVHMYSCDPKQEYASKVIG